VFAAYHSDAEGLNIQVYNRCVGTRYCANNCPYTVRIFNWFDPYFPEPLNQQLNPDVTVRYRGVMEKCTFCIQRIKRAEQEAARDGRELADGDVVPACVQTCPPKVFTFGDASNHESEVAKLMRSRRGFQVLGDLGTDPAVIYLKGGESHAG
jgi:molybdopterin-containing oxidoreductase family iron-sulfur binding subunit